MKKNLAALGMSVVLGTMFIMTGCGSSGSKKTPSPETPAAESGADTGADTGAESSQAAETAAGSSQVTKDNAKWKVGVTITDLTVPVWEDYAKAIRKYGEPEGMYVNIVSPEGNAAEQISQMENFVTDGYDVIVVSAADNESMSQEAKKVTEDGVIVFSQGYEFDNYTAAMLEEKQVFGHHTAEMASRWINEKYPDGKCKVIVAGNQTIPLMMERTEGIYNGLKEFAPNAEVVATVYGSNEEEFLPVMENAFTANPDADMVISYCAGGALAAREAAKGMGMASDDFGIFCTDCDDGVADALYNDDLIRGALSMGGGDYMAKAVVETLVKILNGEEYDKVINFPEIEVNKDNVLEQADALGYKVQSAK